MIKVLFFASLREKLQSSELSLEWPIENTVLALATQLAEQGGDNWQLLLAEETVCAINQQVAERDAVVKDGDEIAFFPPVTGG